MDQIKVGEEIKVIKGDYAGKVGEVLNFNKSTGYAVKFPFRNSAGFHVCVVFPIDYVEKA